MKPFLLYFTLLLPVANNLLAQNDTSTHYLLVNKEKDVVDVIHTILKKKTITANKTDTSLSYTKINYAILPAIGYTLQTGMAAVVTANAGFYLYKHPEQKISSLNASFTYSQYNQTILPFFANIWTKNNRINSTSDFRFVKYPSDIYGLGGRRMSIDENSNTAYTINFLSLKLHQTFMFSTYKNLYVGGGVFYDNYWNIKALDSLKRNVSHLLNRSLGQSEKAVGIVIKASYDTRLNQINANNGLYASVMLRPNFTFLGSDNNWASFHADIRGYTKFPKKSDNILAFWGYSWNIISQTPAPYLMLPSIGWDDQYNTGRGYIQGRFRGRNMLYYENEYRFKLLSNGLLGGVVFANAAHFSSDLSKQFNNFKIGYGLGLRIKLNKASKANLCLDYAFGENGSQGLFVNIGEVF